MEFAEKTFKITENVSFSILMAYFDGHPIVQTKSLKLNYHGQLQEMKSGNRLYDSLIKHGLQTLDALNLLNYLSRLIYAENVYEVYVNNSNQSDYVSEMKEYITHNTEVRSDPRNKRFELIDGLTNTEGNILLEELNKHRNEDFPLVIHNFEEIEVAPLFTYVHPSLAINQGTTIHLCHFAFLLERLSHISAYPEFNNQAIMSLLGNVFEAEESELTVEDINKSTYEEMVEEINKLRNDNKKKQDKLDQLIKMNRELLRKTDGLETQNNELKETIDELYNMNLSSGVTIRSVNNKMDRLIEASKTVHDQISAIKVKDIKQHKTNDVLILYTSAEKPRDNELRERTPEGCIWISTFNGQRLNFKYPHIPKDRIVIFESNSNRLDSFKLLLDRPNVSRFIQDRTKYREILIRIDQQEEFIRIIQDELDRDDNYPVVNNLEEANVNQIDNEEIEFKRNLLQQYNPCLISLNRYKRRIYAKVNDELVLVEEVQNPEDYEWMYRYGPNGSKFGKLDLEVLRTSRFTNELETRINYE